MSPEELDKHSKVIDDSVKWIERKTDAIWHRYESIDECFSQECEEEKADLMNQMDLYIEKLHKEEKRIDKYEEILHNESGKK